MTESNADDTSFESDLEQELQQEESTRHATNLELFLDLVFVFAITQLTGYLAKHHDLVGLGQVLLLTFMAWWLWTAFTWAGTSTDLQSNARGRVVVLTMIGPALLLAIVIPKALSDYGAWFGLAYLVVMVIVTLLQVVNAWEHAEARAAVLSYARVALLMPIVVAIGGFTPPEIRVWIWLGAMLVSAAGAFMQNGSQGTWLVDPVHFAERHALIIIISLGESLVAIGTKAYAHMEYGTLDASVTAAVLVAVAMASAFWWVYFAYIPTIFEHVLAHSDGALRASRARDIGSFGHFALVVAMLMYAVVAKHLVEHPLDQLTTADRWLLFGAVAGFNGGLIWAQWIIVHNISRERLFIIACTAGWLVISDSLPALTVVAVLALFLIAAATYLWQSIRRNMADVVH